MYLINENVWISFEGLLKFVRRFESKYSSIGSDTDFSPTRLEAITETTDAQVTDAYMSHSASMS